MTENREDRNAPQLIEAMAPVGQRIAASIFKLAHPEPPEYVGTQAQKFRHLDLKGYEKAIVQFEALGYTVRMNVESLAHRRSSGQRTVLAFSITEDGSRVSLVFQPGAPQKIRFAWLKRLFGRLPKTHSRTMIEIETVFSNGTQLVTNNMAGLNPFGTPPEIISILLPPDTPIPEIDRIHQQKMQEIMAATPGLQAEAAHNLADLTRRSEQANQYKANYRRAIGYVTTEELQALTKENYPYLETTIRAELARLVAGGAPAATSVTSATSATAGSAQKSAQKGTQSSTPQAVPEWAAFFTPEQYARFNQLVRADFLQRGQMPTIQDGVLHVPGQAGQLGLQNLAQLCHQEPDPANWPGLIAEHFANLNRALGSMDQVLGQQSDFEQVKANLTLRLYPADHFQTLPAKDRPISRVDLDGTLSVLVLDLPSAIMPLSRAMAQDWGKSDAELFAMAANWLRHDTDLESGAVELAKGISVQMIASDSFYAASQALVLDERAGFVGSHGALVCVPHRQGLLSYPIENRQVSQAIQYLIPAVQGMFQEGPGSISPHLYWYRNQKFMRLPLNKANNGVASPAFAAFVDSLPD
jgi:hypothetical protein